jgi:hypothetical protein
MPTIICLELIRPMSNSSTTNACLCLAVVGGYSHLGHQRQEFRSYLETNMVVVWRTLSCKNDALISLNPEEESD